MSMLSSQIDELRELADDIESRYGYPTAVKALRDAADTIWQLRDDLQRANAENVRLRDELDAAKHDLSLFSERIVELGAENAKLRELALVFYDAIDSVFWDGETETKERFKPLMRELGIETGDE